MNTTETSSPARKLSENSESSSPQTRSNRSSGINFVAKRRSQTKSFSRSKQRLLKDKPVSLSQRKLEDTCMKRLMMVLFGYSEERVHMVTITQKRVELNKEYIKFVDSLAGVLVLVNITLALIETEEFYGNHNKVSASTNTQRSVIMAFSFLLVALVCISNYLRLRVEKMQMRRLQEDNLLSSRKIYPLLLEVCICCICCPPDVETLFSGELLLGRYTYSLDSVLFVMQLMKLYLLLRVWLHFSMWTSEQSQHICKKFKIQADMTFALKAELKYRPLKFLGLITIATIIILGMAVRVFEISYRPFDDNPSLNQIVCTNSYDWRGQSTDDLSQQFCEKKIIREQYKSEFVINNWWLVIITMTTVGFGDAYPFTHTGRAICFIACIIGQVLVSLLVVSLTNASEFTQEESKAYHTIKKIDVTSKTKERASNVIKNFLRLLHLNNQKDPYSAAKKFFIQLRLKREIEGFEKEYQTSQVDNLPLDEMLKNLGERISGQIEIIKKEVDRLHELEVRMEQLKYSQIETSNVMNEIIRLQGQTTQLWQKNFT